jgi:hypothetical protein
MVVVDAENGEGGSRSPKKEQEKLFDNPHEAPQAMMLRSYELSILPPRFQRRNAPARILQKTPESLQKQDRGIARSSVMFALHTSRRDFT